MKYMKVLDSVELTDVFDKAVVDEKGEPVKLTFEQFVLGRLSDPQFSKNMDMVMSAFQIKQALDKCNGTLELETSDWNNLVEAVKNPSPQTAYHPLYAVNLVPFMKEIINATDENKIESDTAN